MIFSLLLYIQDAVGLGNVARGIAKLTKFLELRKFD